MINIDGPRSEILSATDNLLIMGGPGSGKTTMALYLAKEIIEKGSLKPGQQILFLSFSRATISRVSQQMGDIIEISMKKSLEINTYHGFIWTILQSHGYLITPNPVKLFPPHIACARLASIPDSDRAALKEKIFLEEGLLHFDLFAKKCFSLFFQCPKLLEMYSDKYPIIIIDEFQDTNSDEWNLISELGKYCRLIALADPEQRIYEFRGADPARINNYITEFTPQIFDFEDQNNRSSGTDIVKFGNDLLTGKNKECSYNNVHIIKYKQQYNEYKHLLLKALVIDLKKGLSKSDGNDWSMGILVPSNRLMLEVSNALLYSQKLANDNNVPSIIHEVLIDSSGPFLSGQVFGYLLECGSTNECTTKNVIEQILLYIRGRRGDREISKSDFAFVTAIEKYVSTSTVRGSKRELFIKECGDLADFCNKYIYTGDIVVDWITIRNRLEQYLSTYILELARDIYYFKLFRKGATLYNSFLLLWIETNSYKGAQKAISDALLQEHFSSTLKVWKGINVMTIHKSKGKEFNKVVIYEDQYQGKIVGRNGIEQARLNLRVAATRAMKETYILTPSNDPCSLL